MFFNWWTTIIIIVFGRTGLGKQCRPRAVWSRSTLFAIPSASFGFSVNFSGVRIFRMFIVSNTRAFKLLSLTGGIKIKKMCDLQIRIFRIFIQSFEVNLVKYYRINLNNLDTQIIAVIILRLEEYLIHYRVLGPKYSDRRPWSDCSSRRSLI